MLETDGSIAEFVMTGITPEQQAAIGDPPRGRGILGLLIREARPRRIPRISEHPESAGFPPNHPLMTSFLGAPVTARGKVLGNIYLTDKRGSAEFDEADEEAIVVLATQAGVAIENARLYRDVERLALLEERERIAKEHHDGVIQSLFAVGMDSRAPRWSRATLRSRNGSAGRSSAKPAAIRRSTAHPSQNGAGGG